jgi:isoleucyl-tRNA synthetase
VGSGLRKAEGLRVRLPLAKLTVVADDAAALEPFRALVADELNVRAVELTDVSGGDTSSFGVRQTLQVNARAAGPRLGKQVQTAIKGSKSGDWSVDGDGSVVAGGIALVEGEYTLQTVVADADPDDARAVAMLPGGGFVILDTAVTAELAAEGLARDVIRAVQQARRDAGFDVSDRITLQVGGGSAVVAAVQAHADLIRSETLAASLDVTQRSLGSDGVDIGDKQQVALEVSRA